MCLISKLIIMKNSWALVLWKSWGGRRITRIFEVCTSKHSCLKGEIYGPLASLELTQIFSFTSQQCSHVIETRYNFSLPGDAAVTAVKVYFGGVEIVTELKEREQAEDEYQKSTK